MFLAGRLSCQRYRLINAPGPFTPLVDLLHSKGSEGRGGGLSMTFGEGGGGDRPRVSLANWFAFRLAHWAVGKDEHVAWLTC